MGARGRQFIALGVGERAVVHVMGVRCDFHQTGFAISADPLQLISRQAASPICG